MDSFILYMNWGHKWAPLNLCKTPETSDWLSVFFNLKWPTIVSPAGAGQCTCTAGLRLHFEQNVFCPPGGQTHVVVTSQKIMNRWFSHLWFQHVVTQKAQMVQITMTDLDYGVPHLLSINSILWHLWDFPCFCHTKYLFSVKMAAVLQHNLVIWY